MLITLKVTQDHIDRGRRTAYRAKRQPWWRAWWPTVKEGLGLGAVAATMYGLSVAILALEATR